MRKSPPFSPLADHSSYTPKPQNDVEEYLGGPDAAVEGVLSAFQDALACVFLNLALLFYLLKPF
jgi:hypothetical protein